MTRHTTQVNSVDELLALPKPYAVPPELADEGVELMIPTGGLLQWVDLNLQAMTHNRERHPPQTPAERDHDALMWSRLWALKDWVVHNPNVQVLLAVQLAPEFEAMPDSLSPP